MRDSALIVAALTTVLPPGIALAHDDPSASPTGLLPGEALAHAVPKRLAEFAAGRRAARTAMAELGLDASAIPHGPDRAPQWPAGVAGSISHTDGMCLAMVGRSRDWAALGLDVESDLPLDTNLWPEVLRPEERDQLNATPQSLQGAAAMATFVAKEAAYKAQYPVNRTLMDFHALLVEWDENRFLARYMLDMPGFAAGTTIPGQVLRAGGYIAAFCAVRRPSDV